MAAPLWMHSVHIASTGPLVQSWAEILMIKPWTWPWAEEAAARACNEVFTLIHSCCRLTEPLSPQAAWLTSYYSLQPVCADFKSSRLTPRCQAAVKAASGRSASQEHLCLRWLERGTCFPAVQQTLFFPFMLHKPFLLLLFILIKRRLQMHCPAETSGNQF